MTQSLTAIWNDPTTGLTEDAFSKWPGGGLRRDKLVDVLQGAMTNGHLSPPVYLVGECTTYDTPHGHPAFGGAIHDFVPFAIWGQPGSPWARVTTMQLKGVFSKRVASEVLPEFDHVEFEDVPTPHGGYLDIQMSHSGSPTARIGLIWSHGRKGGRDGAHQRFEAFGAALLQCREGRLPNA